MIFVFAQITRMYPFCDCPVSDIRPVACIQHHRFKFAHQLFQYTLLSVKGSCQNILGWLFVVGRVARHCLNIKQLAFRSAWQIHCGLTYRREGTRNIRLFIEETRSFEPAHESKLYFTGWKRTRERNKSEKDWNCTKLQPTLKQVIFPFDPIVVGSKESVVRKKGE